MSDKKPKFYITTAINYTNGNPHIGHAYEAIVTDTIARFYRLFGYDVYFLTGTDEHGQKVASKAESLEKDPKELCDMYVMKFKELNAKLNISNNYFIRTTDPKHHVNAKALWNCCKESGDIYLDKYTGWYNVKEECFVTETDAKMHDYKDPTTGLEYTKVSESSYFFRLSKYQDFLIKYIEDNRDFITPDRYRNNILNRLKNQPLNDLSISRTTCNWGVPVPDDEDHVMYVWFDALSNYLTAVDVLDTTGTDQSYWTEGNIVHMIGKDITWFHCVIWPAMLQSAGIALPRMVYSHGYSSNY